MFTLFTPHFLILSCFPVVNFEIPWEKFCSICGRQNGHEWRCMVCGFALEGKRSLSSLQASAGSAYDLSMFLVIPARFTVHIRSIFRPLILSIYSHALVG